MAVISILIFICLPLDCVLFDTVLWLCLSLPTSKMGISNLFSLISRCAGARCCPSWLGKLSPAGICMAWRGKGESGAETWTHPAARGKGSRGQGTARDHDEWRPVEGGLRWDWRWGCEQGPVLSSFPILAQPWCLATPGWGREGGHQSPGDTGRERSKGHEGTGLEGWKPRPASGTAASLLPMGPLPWGPGVCPTDPALLLSAHITQRDQPITLDSLRLCHDPWFWWAEKESQDLGGLRVQTPICSQTPTASTMAGLCNLSSNGFLITSSSHLLCTVTGPNQGEVAHGVSPIPCAFLTQSSCHTGFDMSAVCPLSSLGAGIMSSSLYFQYCPQWAGSEEVLKTVE